MVIAQNDAAPLLVVAYHYMTANRSQGAMQNYLNPTRRLMLQGAASLGATALLSRPALAAAPLLSVQSRQIEVLGKSATVYGIIGPTGKPGWIGAEGDEFAGDIVNGTDLGLALHYHGQVIAPYTADRARPDGKELPPGASEPVRFAATPGTHWMHSHSLTEQQLLAAPMVAREKSSAGMADAVIMLHDFSFASPAELLANLGGSNMHTGMEMDHSTMGAHDGTMDMSGMAGMTHANDITYDAFLANDRTLADPEIIQAEPGAPIRLRIINAATSSAFWVQTGALVAQVVAVDGNPCLPLTGNSFPLAQGQRIDLIVSLPLTGGSFPILAQLESSRRRTGVILASSGAKIDRVPEEAETEAAFADLSLDQALTAANPLPQKAATAVHHLLLGQDAGYAWTINGKLHGDHTPLLARTGERVELMFMNQSMMMHPMHLHGHHFQVVDINGWRYSGPIRDTVIVPPMAMVTVALDAASAGAWFLHCHHLYHMVTGMKTELVVS